MELPGVDQQGKAETCVDHAIAKCVLALCQLNKIIVPQSFVLGVIEAVFKNGKSKDPEKFNNEVIFIQNHSEGGSSRRLILEVKKTHQYVKQPEKIQYVTGQADHCVYIQDLVENTFVCVNSEGIVNPRPQFPVNEVLKSMYSVELYLHPRVPGQDSLSNFEPEPVPEPEFSGLGVVNGHENIVRPADPGSCEQNGNENSPSSSSMEWNGNEFGGKGKQGPSSSQTADSGYSSTCNRTQENTAGSSSLEMVDGGYSSISNGTQGNITGSSSSVIVDNGYSSICNGTQENTAAGNKRKLSLSDTPVETKRKRERTAKPNGKEKKTACNKRKLPLGDKSAGNKRKLPLGDKSGEITKNYKILGVNGDTFYQCSYCRRSLGKDIKGKKHECPECLTKVTVQNIKESYYIHIMVDNLGKLTAYKDHVEQFLGKKLSCEKAKDLLSDYPKLKITHDGKKMIKKLQKPS